VCSLPGFFGPKSESNVRGQLARRTTYCGQALRQIRLSRNLDDEEWILIFASVKRTDFVGFMPIIFAIKFCISMIRAADISATLYSPGDLGLSI
jgi:hypothetical protein